ncbi:MAG: protein pyrBI [Hungatella sp.]|jgi:hypothetical protein|nr:protein pyrBI [Hungatella sp.]
MKRIISACLEQTQRFESEISYQAYIESLECKRIKYKIIDKQIQSDNTVVIKIIRDYNSYPVDGYLDYF